MPNACVAVEHAEHVAGVGRVEATGHAGRGQRDVEHRDRSRVTAPVRTQLDVETEHACALGQQRVIAQEGQRPGEITGERKLRER